MQTETVPMSLLGLYNLAWQAVLPLLKTNKRLKQGFNQRRSANHLSKCDIWIQAASAGEAYLAAELVKRLRRDTKTTILVSSTTAQGMDILKQEIDPKKLHPGIRCKLTWFPFDMPDLMETVLERLDPTTMVLLETELWPGLLSALKKRGTTILIVNARLSEKSFKAYQRTTFIWKHLAPDRIQAISEKDASRFRTLFTTTTIDVMPNIKFDAMDCHDSTPTKASSLEMLFDPNTPLSILASVRMEEEHPVEQILERLLNRFPDQVVALFPRHMHRLDFWKQRLTANGYSWQLRSETKTPAEPGSIVLWDVFGELKQAYSLAVTAFVGGSLHPLGGQNFMEPVIAGAATVIGPHFSDFLWVGEEIFKKGVVYKAENWQKVADFMIKNLNHVPNRAKLMEQGQRFIRKRQGGTALAINQITRSLEKI
ncbi:MAG: 3-deoxy-D-manno-octulosonic acid transferase [Desulfobacterium sp.]|nr:3-deoxy-D-manno-octulosonic acid transferase [Desulfobacterium sp.]